MYWKGERVWGRPYESLSSLSPSSHPRAVCMPLPSHEHPRAVITCSKAQHHCVWNSRSPALKINKQTHAVVPAQLDSSLALLRPRCTCRSDAILLHDFVAFPSHLEATPKQVDTVALSVNGRASRLPRTARCRLSFLVLTRAHTAPYVASEFHIFSKPPCISPKSD